MLNTSNFINKHMKSLSILLRSFGSKLFNVDKFTTISQIGEAAKLHSTKLQKDEVLDMFHKCFSIKNFNDLRTDQLIQPVIVAVEKHLPNVAPAEAIQLVKRMIQLMYPKPEMWISLMSKCKEGIENFTANDYYYLALAYQGIVESKIYVDKICIGKEIMRKAAENVKCYSSRTLVEIASMRKLTKENKNALEVIFEEIQRNVNDLHSSEVNLLMQVTVIGSPGIWEEQYI